MPKRNKKVASLSGSLLVQEGSDSKVGFVLKPLDEIDKEPAEVGSGGKPERVKDREPRPPSDRPSLHAVAQEDCRQAVHSDHRAVSETPGESGPTPVPSQESETGSVDEASLDSRGDTGKDLCPRDFLAALREGNLAKAEGVFGQLTGLDSVRTKRVLYGPGGRNLVLACKALGVEQLQLVSILILTRKLGQNGTSLTPGQLTDLASYFSDINEASAKRVLNQWRTEFIEVFGEQS